MHSAVREEHSPKAVGFQPVTVEKKKTLTWFAGDIQTLTDFVIIFLIRLHAY